jgi:hypothetical protein
MKNEKKKLIFVSRHEPNNGQVAIANRLGYEGIKKVSVVFGTDPIADLKAAGVSEKEIAIVAPSHITNLLLNAGYSLIEFVNSPEKREKMVFVCKCAYKMRLNNNKIEQEYISCPISIDKQYESSIV